MAGDSKTEKATPKKRRDERKKGNVFQSKDIVSIASILIIFLSLKMMFPFMYGTIKDFLIKYFAMGVEVEALTIPVLGAIFRDGLITFMMVVMPLMLISIAISILATGVQTRFLFSMESLKPKFSRLSPLQGFKKMFSMRSIVEVVKAIIKIAVIIYLIYSFFMKNMDTFARMVDMDVAQAASIFLNDVIDLVLNVCMIFIFVAAIDFMYQLWDYERQIKMSKHDLKEEYKQMEGDPQVKGKIKERQRKIAMSRMMQQVPSADVVIKNPTHYAVALRYNLEHDAAPIVVAKGQDDIAMKIIQTAQEHNIEIVENVPLARALYATSDLNREIGDEFFGVVAEILAYIYKQKNITV